MTSHRESKRARGRARSTNIRTLFAAVLCASVAGWAGACSTVETVSFGDGDCVGVKCQQAGATSSSSSSSSAGGGTSSTGSTSTTTMCTVDPNCSVKWGAEIFATIIDNVDTGCTATGVCHGSGKGGITIQSGMPHEAYMAFMAYTLLDQPGPVKKYIVPCDKDASGILCNAKPESGMTNPYGACGSLMPLLGTNLTMTQLNMIADWIACGAPEN
jgi:hypothetical protein